MSPPKLLGKSAEDWRFQILAFVWVGVVFGVIGLILWVVGASKAAGWVQGAPSFGGLALLSFVLWKVQVRRERKYEAAQDGSSGPGQSGS